MNMPPDSNDSPADVAATEASVDAPKPVRRRRATKVAVDGDAAPLPVDLSAEQPGDEGTESSDAPPLKPARARRPKARVAEEAAPTLATDPAVESSGIESSAALAKPAQAADSATPLTEAAVGAESGSEQAAPRGLRTGRNRRRRTGAVAEPGAGFSADDEMSDGSTPAQAERSAGPSAGASDGPAGERGERTDPNGNEGARREHPQGQRAVAPVVMPDAGERFAEVLSGAFDSGEDGAELDSAGPDSAGAERAKRVLLPEPEAPKLHKVLAQSGIGSRRDMEKLIEEGLVEVNGQVAHTGQRVALGDQVKVRGKPVRLRIFPGPPRILAYHKPVGEVVTHDDPQQRPTVFRNLPRLAQGKWQSVGRLDLNTEGLLLFTNSGELANQLMHPRFGVEREYAVRVLGTLDAEARAKLLSGVDVEGQMACFKSIENGGGEGVNHWYRVVITEGRNREVRKLFDSVGLAVSRLIRIRYGTVVLPRGLKRGVWVDLPESDVRTIRQLASPHAGRGGGRDASPGDAQARGPKVQQGQKRGPRGSERGDERGPDRSSGRGGVPDRGPKPPLQSQKDRRRMDERRPASADTPRPAGSEDWEDDFDPARIPNPLEQTFDKRFVKNPRSPAGGRGFRDGGGGFGAGGSAATPAPKPARGGPREPDPLQTSVGYIGADAYHQRGGRGGGGGGRGGSGGGRRGGGR